MAFAEFSSDLKERQLPPGLLDMHANDEHGANQANGLSYRIRLALIVAASLVLWGAIFETARLIFA